jgi:hypothetical protein
MSPFRPRGFAFSPARALPQGQGLVFIEAEALGNDGCPQDQHGRTVDGDGCHAVIRPIARRYRLPPSLDRPATSRRVLVSFRGPVPTGDHASGGTNNARD